MLVEAITTATIGAMKPVIRICLAALLAGLVPALSSAATDFYSATVPVADHSAAARQQAARAGMLAMLVRLTGIRAPQDEPAVRTMLADVSSYLVEYSYVTREAVDDGAAPGGLGVRIRYDRAGVDRFLRDHALPIWPLNRPRLLVWVVADEGREPAFLSGDEAAPVIADLDHSFDRRGLPVVYPLHDLEDQMVLDARQAREFDTEALAEASARYPVQGWLVLRYYQTSGQQWRGAWMLGRDDQTLLRQSEADTLEGLLDAVVDEVVDAVAENQSYVAHSTTDSLQLDVEGVASYGDYSRLTTLLEGLSMIRAVRVTGLDGDRISLSLAIEGGREQLLESLYRNPAIRPLAGGSAAADGIERLRWVSGR